MRIILLIILVNFSLLVFSQEKIIVLHSGETYRGKVIGMKNNRFHLETPYGEIQFSFSQIKSIQSIYGNQNFKITTRGNEVFIGKIVNETATQLQIESLYGKFTVNKKEIIERKKFFPESPKEKTPITPKSEIKDVPKEKINEIPKPKITDIPKEKPQETPKPKIADIPKEKPQETPKPKITDIPKEKPQETPQSKITDVPKEKPQVIVSKPQVTDKPKETPLETPQPKITEHSGKTTSSDSSNQEYLKFKGRFRGKKLSSENQKIVQGNLELLDAMIMMMEFEEPDLLENLKKSHFFTENGEWVSNLKTFSEYSGLFDKPLCFPEKGNYGFDSQSGKSFYYVAP